MNCPKCGKEILDGHMYCEDCGQEINLVPEFEAEVEESMAESIQGILDKAELKTDPDTDVEDMPEGFPIDESPKKSGPLFVLSGGAVAVLLFVLATVIIGGLTIWNHSTFIHEMIVEYYMDDGDYASAIAYMEETVQKAPEKVAHRFKLCELYMEAGQEEKALEAYKIIAVSPQYTFDEQITAVEQVVNYYDAREDYESIAEYLATIQDQNMQMVFWEYMSGTVNFSQPEGTYATMITLKLDSDGIGTIYYTTDGTEPTTDSPEFSGTIFLETGENTISAIFVNDYGVSSPVVTKNYFIESKKVSPPEVVTYSGTYNCPVKIEIIANYDSRIYYTTDGSAPNRNSAQYTGALYAPLGKSVYKFIAIDSRGEVSEIITRDFQINLDTELTTDAATEILVNYFINQGKASDGNGHIMQDETHILIYEYLYPMSVEVGKDCYYFAEVSRDTTSGEQHRTGAYYGVDIRTKEIYAFMQ